MAQAGRGSVPSDQIRLDPTRSDQKNEQRITGRRA